MGETRRQRSVRCSRFRRKPENRFRGQAQRPASDWKCVRWVWRSRRTSPRRRRRAPGAACPRAPPAACWRDACPRPATSGPGDVDAPGQEQHLSSRRHLGGFHSALLNLSLPWPACRRCSATRCPPPGPRGTPGTRTAAAGSPPEERLWLPNSRVEPGSAQAVSCCPPLLEQQVVIGLSGRDCERSGAFPASRYRRGFRSHWSQPAPACVPSDPPEERLPPPDCLHHPRWAGEPEPSQSCGPLRRSASSTACCFSAPGPSLNMHKHTTLAFSASSWRDLTPPFRHGPLHHHLGCVRARQAAGDRWRVWLCGPGSTCLAPLWSPLPRSTWNLRTTIALGENQVPFQPSLGADRGVPLQLLWECWYFLNLFSACLLGFLSSRAQRWGSPEEKPHASRSAAARLNRRSKASQIQLADDYDKKRERTKRAPKRGFVKKTKKENPNDLQRQWYNSRCRLVFQWRWNNRCWPPEQQGSRFPWQQPDNADRRTDMFNLIWPASVLKLDIQHNTRISVTIIRTKTVIPYYVGVFNHLKPGQNKYQTRTRTWFDWITKTKTWV